MTWEGVFGFIWTLIQLLFWVAALAGAAILVFAILVICWRAAKGILAKTSEGMSRETFDKEAKAIALNMSASGQLNNVPAQTFLQGTVWAWGALHRKK